MAILFSFAMAGAQTIQQNEAVVLRAENEVWNQGNLAVVDEIYAPDFICHFVDGIEWRGLSGMKAAVASHRKSFPDWHERVEDILAQGDRVVIRIHSTGTQLGAFNGIPPSGKRVSIEEIHIFRLEHGKIVEQWGMPDVHGLLEQLGVHGNGAMKMQPTANAR
ncbi:MAG TPA: ester cyclase [Terracidiphilus sp.]|nr:ester cyclase [Terracidiphilus sp.]